MLIFLYSFFSKRSISKVLFSILLMGFAQTTTAHTYYFGVSELNLNKDTKHIEVIHQFTAHDLENAIAEIQQVHFSAEHPEYNELIQSYIEKHFTLARNGQTIEMNWIGFEVKRGQIFAYQESKSKNHLMNLMVKNTILVDTFEKQINIVNYQSLNSESKSQGSLTFDQSLRSAIITTTE